jgi:hypothetical protein
MAVMLSEVPWEHALLHLWDLHHGAFPLFSQASAPSLTQYSISVEYVHPHPSGTSFKCGIGRILAQMWLKTDRLRASHVSALPAPFLAITIRPIILLAFRKLHMEYWV